MRFVELINYLYFCKVCKNNTREIACSTSPDEFVLNSFSFHNDEAIFRLSMKDRAIYCDSDNLDIKSGSVDIDLAVDYDTNTYNSNFDLGYGYPLSITFDSYCNVCGSATYSSDVFFTDGEIKSIYIEQDKFILDNKNFIYTVRVYPTRIKVYRYAANDARSTPVYLPPFNMDFSNIKSICNKIDKLLLLS